MGKLKHNRRETVRVGVIAPALLAAAGVLSYRMEWLSTDFTGSLGSIGSWLTQPVSVPLWLLVLTVVCTGFIMLAVVARMLAARISQPGWHTYQSDFLMGVRWQWTYNKGRAVANLNSFCPGCENLVYPGPGPESRSTAFQCALCNETMVVLDHPPEELKAAVIRMIEQKLQMHTWPGAATRGADPAVGPRGERTH